MKPVPVEQELFFLGSQSRKKGTSQLDSWPLQHCCLAAADSAAATFPAPTTPSDVALPAAAADNEAAQGQCVDYTAHAQPIDCEHWLAEDCCSHLSHAATVTVLPDCLQHHMRYPVINVVKRLLSGFWFQAAFLSQHYQVPNCKLTDLCIVGKRMRVCHDHHCEL